MSKGLSWSVVEISLWRFILTTVLIYLVLPVTAFIAMLGKGYIAPIGFASVATMSNRCSSTATIPT
ncbi:MAG: hypothetical protein ACYC56_09975 [Candidatus Aquicultor sp.]